MIRLLSERGWPEKRTSLGGEADGRIREREVGAEGCVRGESGPGVTSEVTKETSSDII